MDLAGTYLKHTTGISYRSYKMHSEAPSSDKSLASIAETLNEIHRPRLFFNISPGQIRPNLLDVTFRNNGGSPAYDINCMFDPDLYYYEKKTLSELIIFKNLSFLEQGQEIRFFFRDLYSIIGEGPAHGPKQTNVTITYRDSKEISYKERYVIDIERYKDLLSLEQRNIDDVYREIGYLRRSIDRLQSSGLLVKTSKDIQEEKKKSEEFYKHLRQEIDGPVNSDTRSAD